MQTAKYQPWDFHHQTNGVIFKLPNPDDYKAFTQYLVERKYPHHSFSTPEEPNLRVLFGGVIENIPIEGIKAVSLMLKAQRIRVFGLSPYRR